MELFADGSNLRSQKAKDLSLDLFISPKSPRARARRCAPMESELTRWANSGSRADRNISLKYLNNHSPVSVEISAARLVLQHGLTIIVHAVRRLSVRRR